jgi:hypothetical protein
MPPSWTLPGREKPAERSRASFPETLREALDRRSTASHSADARTLFLGLFMMKISKRDFSPIAFITVLIGATATLAWTGFLVWGFFEIVGLL